MRLARFLLPCLLLAPPALAQQSGLFHTAADVRLARPLITNDGAQTRLTFALPPDVTYTLTLGPASLDLAVQGARVEVAGLKAPGPSVSEYRAGSGVVNLRTPFPLSLMEGWRGSETRTGAGGRLLVLEFGPTLTGGATGAVRAQVRTTTSRPVLSSVPPGDTVAPAPVTPAISTAAPTVPPAPAQRPVTALSVPRIERLQGLTRLTLDLPAGTIPRVTVVNGTLQVTLAGLNAPALQGREGTPELRGWRYDPASLGATLTLMTPTPLRERGGWQAITRGDQLILDLSPALADRTPLTPRDRLAALPAAPALPGAALLAFPAAQPRPRVVIDPGHGGKDPGAVGAVTEKQVTLEVARRVQTLLRQAGVDAVLTRDGDRELNPDKATDLKLRAGLGTPGTGLFLSIHVNAMPAANALRGYGVETWWNPNHPRSQDLAAVLQKNVVAVTGAYSQGLKNSQSLAVLRESRIPAALVEIGFTTHPVDGLNLQDPNYLERVALGIAQGVREALVTGLTAGR
ncbi:N-acetylmuramoyl-L-alanine amidase [Deinococcus aluminii]|uniref:MurNAc-LAA domain-containing protein n=1 Tax=Deinococcus aluminii TaxID=1656885 RepID=A0ABP9XEP1_9DEIO